MSDLWLDVHEVGDGLAGLAHRAPLEPLPDLEEQHHGDGLGEHDLGDARQGRYEERTESGDGHEEVLVEHLSVADVACGLEEDVVPDDEIRGKEDGQLDDCVRVQYVMQRESDGEKRTADSHPACEDVQVIAFT